MPVSELSGIPAAIVKFHAFLQNDFPQLKEFTRTPSMKLMAVWRLLVMLDDPKATKALQDVYTRNFPFYCDIIMWMALLKDNNLALEQKLTSLTQRCTACAVKAFP